MCSANQIQDEQILATLKVSEEAARRVLFVGGVFALDEQG